MINLFDSIADDILESCVNDVSKELDQINSDVVDHIYNAEFSVVQWLEHARHICCLFSDLTSCVFT